MKKSKYFRKNPAFYQYGYHFTNKLELDSILLTGFLKTAKAVRGFEKFYNLKPVYLMTYDKINHIKNIMKNYIGEKDYILKVDVSQYDQYPDFGSLFDNAFDYKKIETNIIISKIREKYTLNFIPKLMKKWIKKFDNEIPLLEFFTNPYLIKDCIATTHSFVVLENIPANKIVSITDISSL